MAVVEAEALHLLKRAEAVPDVEEVPQARQADYLPWPETVSVAKGQRLQHQPQGWLKRAVQVGGSLRQPQQVQLAAALFMLLRAEVGVDA